MRADYVEEDKREKLRRIKADYEWRNPPAPSKTIKAVKKPNAVAGFFIETIKFIGLIALLISVVGGFIYYLYYYSHWTPPASTTETFILAWIIGAVSMLHIVKSLDREIAKLRHEISVRDQAIR